MLQSEASGGSRTTNGMVVVMIELNEQMIDAWISDHREEMLEELMEWVRHPSVSRADLASPGAPYGPDCRKMLDFALKRCREMGFRTEDHEGYCGSVWYGDAEDELGFYAHLDVVPEGENWIYQPYDPVVEKGFMIGRGCDDDKAPAIMGVYILRFLKEHGIKLNKTVRLMFGCAEETGMDDFASYLGKGGRVSDFGIVADGGFPVCFAEKGGWNADILVKKGADILDFRAGNVRNAVPGSASILLRGDAEELKKRLSENEASEKLFDDISKLSVAEGEEPGTVRVSATGKAGHAAFPDGADSAQAPTNGASDVAEFAFTGVAVLTWIWEPVESGEPRRALVDPDDVPAGKEGESLLTIVPNGDDTLTLKACVGNAVKGYWYAIVTDTDLTGDYEEVFAYSYADADGELDLGEHEVDPDDERRFFKVRIYEEDPDGE